MKSISCFWSFCLSSGLVACCLVSVFKFWSCRCLLAVLLVLWCFACLLLFLTVVRSWCLLSGFYACPLVFVLVFWSYACLLVGVLVFWSLCLSIPRHFIYRHFVYYCIPGYRTVIHPTSVSANHYFHQFQLLLKL